MADVRIGGQAVIEGVMMKNKEKYAIAVRKPDKDIEVKIESYKPSADKGLFFRLPIIRGVFNFVESLVIGVKTLTYSASFYDEEEEDNKSIKDTGGDADKKEADKKEKSVFQKNQYFGKKTPARRTDTVVRMPDQIKQPEQEHAPSHASCPVSHPGRGAILHENPDKDHRQDYLQRGIHLRQNSPYTHFYRRRGNVFRFFCRFPYHVGNQMHLHAPFSAFADIKR